MRSWISVKRSLSAVVYLLVLAGAFAAGATAQDQVPTGQPAEAAGQTPIPELPNFGEFPGLDGAGVAGLGGENGAELYFSSSLTIAQGSREGKLAIKATLAPKWHTYAIDQKGGPGPSKLTIKTAGVLELTGAFQPDKPPHVRKVPEFDVPLAEHYDEVTWTAPVRLVEGVEAEKAELVVHFDGLVCHDQDGCKPVFDRKIQVKFTGFDDPATTAAEAKSVAADSAATAPAPATPAAVAEFRAKRSHATIRGHVEPAAVMPGGKVKLVLTVETDPHFHIYTYSPRDVAGQPLKRTLIAVTTPPGWTVGPVTASTAPLSKEVIPGDPPIEFHEGTVSWTTELTVPAETPPGEFVLSGAIGYQTCEDTACDPPTGAKFTVKVAAGADSARQQLPLAFSPGAYGAVAKQLESVAAAPPPTTSPNEPNEPNAAAPVLNLGQFDLSANKSADQSIPAILAIALLGGFILNFMPCVLPVIGLKALSFVQQAGESRAKILTLNLWYTVGVLTVFVALATLIAVFNKGWGEQFNDVRVNVVLASVVFVMSLSFLGVWEIPIPGFVGSGKAAELSQKEGPLGAFMLGIIATVLATPCSGPGIATALAWCQNKPPLLVYLVFLALGLGMASPYLAIGINPKLIKFIPKPGMWMETFKETMGFLLLGTVVFFLTFIDWVYLVPSIAMLFGLWGACWWIGRTPITAELQVKLGTWLSAGVFAAGIGLYAFSTQIGIGDYKTYGLRGIMEYRLTAYVDRHVQDRLADQAGGSAQLASTAKKPENEFELPWQPFSQKQLEKLLAEKKTVMVDFTADWCLTCKTLEQFVLNTRDVRRVVDDHGVVPLVADWTDRGEEIKTMLNALGSEQVPVLAIFPASRPNQPIVLLGGYTQQKLIQHLEAAVSAENSADEQVAGFNPPAAEVADRNR